MRNVIPYMVVIILFLTGCAASPQPIVAERRVHCAVRDNGSIDCSRIFFVTESSRFRALLDILAPDPRELIFECPDGSAHTISLTSENRNDVGFEGLTESQLDSAVETCNSQVETEVGGSFNSSGYQNAVTNAVSKTDEQIANCVAGWDERMPYGKRGGENRGSRKKVEGKRQRGKILTIAPITIYLDPEPQEYWKSQGIYHGPPSGSVQEYWKSQGIYYGPPSGPAQRTGTGTGGKKGWSSSTDTNGTVTYTRTNEDGSTTVFVCPKGATKCEINEVPPPKPPPPPPPQPSGGETSQAGYCLETDCTSTCEEMEEWWKQFKKTCDAQRWQTYDCASYVAAMNGCPDPATIIPHPDGDFVCASPADAKTIRELREAFCQFKGGLMQSCRADNGQCTECQMKSEFRSDWSPFDICNDPRALVQNDQCLLEIDLPIYEPPEIDNGRPGPPPVNPE